MCGRLFFWLIGFIALKGRSNHPCIFNALTPQPKLTLPTDFQILRPVLCRDI